VFSPLVVAAVLLSIDLLNLGIQCSALNYGLSCPMPSPMTHTRVIALLPKVCGRRAGRIRGRMGSAVNGRFEAIRIEVGHTIGSSGT
jgi:hypothetical protein